MSGQNLRKDHQKVDAATFLKEDIERILKMSKEVKKWNKEELGEKAGELLFLVTSTNEKLRLLEFMDKDMAKVREAIGIAARNAGIELFNTHQKLGYSGRVLDMVRQEFGDFPVLHEKVLQDRADLEQADRNMYHAQYSEFDYSPAPWSSGWSSVGTYSPPVKKQSETERQFYIGQSYFKKKDYADAEYYLLRAATKGNTSAMQLLMQIEEEKRNAKIQKQKKRRRTLLLTVMVPVVLLIGSLVCTLLGMKAYEGKQYADAAAYLQFSFVNRDVYRESVYQYGMQALREGKPQNAQITFSKVMSDYPEEYRYSCGVARLKGTDTIPNVHNMLNAALSDFESAGNVLDTKAFIQAIKALQEKRYADGFEVLVEKDLLPRESLRRILESLEEKDRLTELNETLQMLKAKEMLLEEKNKWNIGNITTSLQKNRVSISGVRKFRDTGRGDKILIVEDGTTVLMDLMILLPAKYIPGNVDEIGYVIELNYGRETVGMYTGGTTAIRENGQVQIFCCGELVHEFDIRYGPYPPDSYMSYGHDAFKSGGKPVMSGDLNSAFEWICANEIPEVPVTES